MDIDPHQWANMPRVVFVIGFSQEYETLVEDAKHWLVRAQGLARVVILVNLIEAPMPPQPTDSEVETEPGSEQEPYDIVDVAANAGGNDADADANDFDPGEAVARPDALPPSSQSFTAQDYVDYLLDLGRSHLWHHRTHRRLSSGTAHREEGFRARCGFACVKYLWLV